MIKLLIIGGSGFLGGNLSLIAPSSWRTYVTYYSSTVYNDKSDFALKLNIANKKEVENLISKISPDIIIHAAALTNMDYCADNQKTAWEINALGTKNIAIAAEKIAARLIYISTDLVFKGDRSFYSEKDCPDPLCYYGKTKLEGEKIVSSLSSNYCIARISLVYGWSVNSSKCFTEIMIENLKQGNRIKLFEDEYRTPIFNRNLCKILIELSEFDTIQGLYNLCGSERLSRLEFGFQLCEIFGFNKKLIIPISVDDIEFKDKRPKDCSMSNEKSMNVLKTEFCSIKEGLVDMRKENVK